MQGCGPDLNTGVMTMRTEDAFVEMDSDDKALEVVDDVARTMLEHPVFVYWCVSCGFEAPEECQPCPRCGNFVQRHQRVLELPDEELDTLSLASLRAALADISASHDVQTSALLLSEQGPDPGVAATFPVLASELAALGVPPAVQRALVKRGFSSIEQIIAAATSAPTEGPLAMKLGLSPAAEVLLRRLWHTAAERRAESQRAASRRRSAQSLCHPDTSDALLGSPRDSGDEGVDDLQRYVTAVSAKRFRVEQCDSPIDDSEEMDEEPTSDSAKRKQRWDDLMHAIEDDS